MHRIVLLLEHDTYVTGCAELSCTVWAWERRVSGSVQLQSCNCLACAYGQGKDPVSGTWWMVKVIYLGGAVGCKVIFVKRGAVLWSINCFSSSSWVWIFLIAGGADHPVGVIPDVLICCWKTSSPKALLS